MISRARDSKSKKSTKKKKSKSKSQRSKATETADESTEETSRLPEAIDHDSTVEVAASPEGAEESTSDAEVTGEATPEASEDAKEPSSEEDGEAPAEESPATKSEGVEPTDAGASESSKEDEEAQSEAAPPDAAPSDAAPSDADAGEDEIPKLEGDRLRSCLEALLFASPEPISRRRLYRLLPEADNAAIREALLELEGELLTTARGYFLVEESSGFRFLSKSEFAPHVARLRGEKRRIRLSAAAFEALAVIAYRQPVRRADLEAIRGVQCGAILKNLLEWSLIRVVGHDESPGRPLLYGTTSDFLEMLGLSDLSDLPEPERLRERGEDRGLQVLDRIIEEGGGEPVVSDEPVAGAKEVSGAEETVAEAAEGSEAPVSEASEGAPSDVEPTASGENPTEEGVPSDSGAEFDLDLDGDDDDS